jgi:hypothetical protein
MRGRPKAGCDDSCLRRAAEYQVASLAGHRVISLVSRPFEHRGQNASVCDAVGRVTYADRAPSYRGRRGRDEAMRSTPDSPTGWYKELQPGEKRTFWARFGGWALDAMDVCRFSVLPSRYHRGLRHI